MKYLKFGDIEAGCDDGSSFEELRKYIQKLMDDNPPEFDKKEKKYEQAISKPKR